MRHEAGVEARIAAWRDASPMFEGDLAADAARLGAYVAEGEALIDETRPPVRGDGSPGATVGHMRTGVQAAREAFLRRHVKAVYDSVTANRATLLRLDQLVAVAAERFAGLLPSAEQMNAERGRIQVEKVGHEVDQGLFIRAVLRDAVAGPHLLDAMRRPTARALHLLNEFERVGHVDLGPVRLERESRTAHLTLQNQGCLNAEDVPLLEALEVAVDLVLLSDAVGVGVLRGAVMEHPKYKGLRVFCSGINLRALRHGQIPLVEFLVMRELGLVNKLRLGLSVGSGEPHDGRQKPWVAVVESFAIGGGMQLLFAMDHVIAAEDAFFSLPAANEGIVPGAANLRIGRQTGSRLARRIILGGQRILASDPEAQLVCDEVVSSDRIDAAIAKAVTALDGPAVLANRHMLNLAEERQDDFRAYIAEFAFVQARRAHSPDVIARLERGWSTSRRSVDA